MNPDLSIIKKSHFIFSSPMTWGTPIPKLSDYMITDETLTDTVDSAYYLGASAITNEAQSLVGKNVITLEEAELIFGEGYAMKRNAVLYFALKTQMDYLIFLDDDEYPIANIKIEQQHRMERPGGPINTY